MAVYVLLMAFLILNRALIPGSSAKSRRNFLILSSIPIILVMGLRNCTIGGNDPVGYYYHFLSAVVTPLPELLSSSRMEPGYIVFVKLLTLISSSPLTLFLAEAAICVFGVCLFIYRNSEQPFLSLFFYITLGEFAFEMMGFRQSIAMSICLVGLEFVKKKKPIPFLLTVALAACFHISAIVFLPVYFLAYRKLSAVNLLLTLYVIPAVILLNHQITDVANGVFSSNYGTGANTGGAVVIAVYLITFGAAFVNQKEVFSHRENLACFNLLALGLITYLFRYWTMASERISFYFFFGLLILLPASIKAVPDEKTRRLAACAAVLLAAGLFYYRLTYQPISPYLFFWEQ